jgi:hypothetical protein
MSKTCEYCNSIFSRQSAVQRHYQTCKMKFLNEQKELYESQLQKQQEQYETKIQTLQNQLQKQQEQYETKNQTLEQKITEQREQIEKLETQIFEIAKQPKQQVNHHNNQKTLNILNQLAPYDLTTEMVQETLQKYSLEKIFNEGPSGITEFVVEKILTDTTTNKPKLIATDRSRGVFKYKDTEGNLYVDNKLTKTADILQRPLFKANDKILLETLRRHNFDIDDFTRKIFNENSDLLNSINKEKLSARLSRRLESDYVPADSLLE